MKYGYRPYVRLGVDLIRPVVTCTLTSWCSAGGLQMPSSGPTSATRSDAENPQKEEFQQNERQGESLSQISVSRARKRAASMGQLQLQMNQVSMFDFV